MANPPIFSLTLSLKELRALSEILKGDGNSLETIELGETMAEYIDEVIANVVLSEPNSESVDTGDGER